MNLLPEIDDLWRNPLIVAHDYRTTGKHAGRLYARQLPELTANQWRDWGLYGTKRGEKTYDAVEKAVESALSLSDDPTMALSALAGIVAELELPTPEADEAEIFPPQPLQPGELLSRRCAQLWQWQESYLETNPEYIEAHERRSL